MTAPLLAPPRLDCPAVLRAGMADAGFEVTVSLVAPLVRSPWEPWVCPCGTHYWMAPTAAQVAVWVLGEAAR